MAGGADGRWPMVLGKGKKAHTDATRTWVGSLALFPRGTIGARPGGPVALKHIAVLDVLVALGLLALLSPRCGSLRCQLHLGGNNVMRLRKTQTDG